MQSLSGLPPMLPSQMSEILDAQSAASALYGGGGSAPAPIDLSQALTPQEQTDLSQLQAAESEVGMLSPGGSAAALSSPAAFLDLSQAAQQQLGQPQPAPAQPAFDPAQDPANPFYGGAPTGSWSATDPVDPSWATDLANPGFYA